MYRTYLLCNECGKVLKKHVIDKEATDKELVERGGYSSNDEHLCPSCNTFISRQHSIKRQKMKGEE